MNGKLCIIMEMPKEAGEQIFVEELNEKAHQNVAKYVAEAAIATKVNKI